METAKSGMRSAILNQTYTKCNREETIRSKNHRQRTTAASSAQKREIMCLLSVGTVVCWSGKGSKTDVTASRVDALLPADFSLPHRKSFKLSAIHRLLLVASLFPSLPPDHISLYHLHLALTISPSTVIIARLLLHPWPRVVLLSPSPSPTFPLRICTSPCDLTSRSCAVPSRAACRLAVSSREDRSKRSSFVCAFLPSPS